MKLTHSYNAPAAPVIPDDLPAAERGILGQLERDRGDLLRGQLSELGRTVLEYIRQHVGIPFVIEWSDPEETPVDPGTVKVTLSVDIKRYREPKKEE